MAQSGEQPVTGGNMTPVVRVGKTIRRQAGPWSPTVQHLLRHLEDKGFDGAPRALGSDERGREMLPYIEGEVGFFDATGTDPPGLWSDQTLVEAATMLRGFHDATIDFVPPDPACWQLVYPDPGQHDVICHNDFAPYNCVFDGGHIRAVIDFDTAGPGPRRWNVALAAYRFVPLVPDEALASFGLSQPVDQASRLRLFCDDYGLAERHAFVDLVVTRIEAILSMLLDGAAAGNEAFQRHLDEGGPIEGYERDRNHVHRHAHDLQAAIDA